MLQLARDSRTSARVRAAAGVSLSTQVPRLAGAVNLKATEELSFLPVALASLLLPECSCEGHCQPADRAVSRHAPASQPVRPPLHAQC